MKLSVTSSTSLLMLVNAEAGSFSIYVHGIYVLSGQSNNVVALSFENLTLNKVTPI